MGQMNTPNNNNNISLIKNDFTKGYNKQGKNESNIYK